jgi:hypothetical protein
MLVFLSEVLGTLVSYISIYYPCYWGLGTILLIFYILLSLPCLGLTMGISEHLCRVCESRGS